MKKKILFYQWKSAFHAAVEQMNVFMPESAKSCIETLMSDLHTQIDSIEEDEVPEEFLVDLFTHKPRNNEQ